MIFTITDFIGTTYRKIKRPDDKPKITQKEFNEVTGRLNRLNDE